MAIQNRPTVNQNFLEFARYWQPKGSNTVVWIEDLTENRKVNFLRWGNQIYLPTYDRMKFGIGVYNGNSGTRAYPSYLEAMNLWAGGPPQPDDCPPNYMWEIQSGAQMVFDKVVGQSQTGRPLEITPTGFGYSIGEATWGSSEFRGQIRVYERTELYERVQRPRPTNDGVVKRSQADDLGLEKAPPSFGESRGRGKAGIGLGEETHQAHHQSGRQYNRDAQPVIFMLVEFRHDLEAMLNQKFGYGAWSWYFDAYGSQWWNDKPYTAGQVPVRPHRPTR